MALPCFICRSEHAGVSSLIGCLKTCPGMLARHGWLPAASSALQEQCQRLQAEAQQARSELAEAVQAATATREEAWQGQLHQEQHERQHAQQLVQARLCVAQQPNPCPSRARHCQHAYGTSRCCRPPLWPAAY